MIGLIITGHAQFASGIASAMNLLAGEVADFQVIDFPAGMDQYDLLERLKKAKTSLLNCEEWVICTDIVSGTPFKMSAMLSMQEEHIRVLTGTNLPLILQMALSRNSIQDTDQLISISLEEASKTIIEFHRENYL